MKKLLFLAFLTGAISFTVSAQPGQCPMHHKGFGKQEGQGPKDHGMAAKLNLSPDQQDKIKAIHEDSRRQMQALRENNQQSVQQFDDAKARIRKESRSKIDAVLTAEQKASMTRMKSEQEDRRKAHHLRRLEALKSKLSLTEAQYSQLKSLHEKNYTALKAIRENENLGPEAKKSSIQKIKDAGEEERKKILTQEQFRKMEEMRKGHFKHKQSETAK